MFTKLSLEIMAWWCDLVLENISPKFNSFFGIVWILYKYNCCNIDRFLNEVKTNHFMCVQRMGYPESYFKSFDSRRGSYSILGEGTIVEPFPRIAILLGFTLLCLKERILWNNIGNLLNWQGLWNLNASKI